MAKGDTCQIANNCSDISPKIYRTSSGVFCNKHYLQIKRHGKVIQSARDKREPIIEGDIVKIPLGVNAKDGYALVDKEFAYLSDKKWGKSYYGYAVCPTTKEKLHRLVTSCPDDKVVDHINGNPLDNRKVNLRVCLPSDNAKNQRIKANNTSGYKGVSLNKRTNLYESYIKSNYKRYHLGNFKSAVEAAQKYDEFALKLHGEYARLNFG